ncbi:hypothetical protein LOTGIDRAFT_171045 [Lottia gigantea]|uniref:Uncharacterized protein n=1 Tax=Lottia gigantea TaxID=225164 RepID=V4BEI4_LOTGI|nr:hypothetical protein LOTGIDRAFT_171045 [Lottia gigantea]ESP04207.1 hypothetical protein LOTGIDRAFT_171045 [Lottia gigantea]
MTWNRRQSNPTRLSSSHLTRIFEEENDQEDSDQEVFYENQSSDGRYKDARSPRRTQSYRECTGASYSSQNARPHHNAYRRYSDNIDVPETLNDSAQSWSQLTQKAESFSDTPAKRNIRSNSMFVGNSTSGRSPSLLSQAEASSNSDIDSNLRRSSMQSDAILTGWNRSNKSASIFENMDIKSTSPNPIRAVLMQYEVSKRTVPLNLKRSLTKPVPMKAFRNDPMDVSSSGNVLASDSSCETGCDSQSQNTSQCSSVSPNTSDQNIQSDKIMEHIPRGFGSVDSGFDHQSKVSPCILNSNDCDKPNPRNCGSQNQNHPNVNVVNNNRDSPKPTSSTPVGTPKHIKYNSIASDDSLFTPSSYSSFCSSNLSSVSFNSTARLPCASIDEGFIESPPLSPDHSQSFYSFHDSPDGKQSKLCVSDSHEGLKVSHKVVQKQKIKEIPSNSRTQTEV